MIRRMLALAGFVVVVALVLLLFYRVYIHHMDAEPYVDDDRAIVLYEAKFTGMRA